MSLNFRSIIDLEIKIDSCGRLPNGSHFLDNWVHDWHSLLFNSPTFFGSLLRKNVRLLFWVSDECLERMTKCYREDISEGLQDWECLFSMSKDWFVSNYKHYPELKQHFIKRPGLWFYVFRYDQKKINPRSGEVSKDLSDAWSIMDYWDIPHNKVVKIGNEFRIVSDN
jgi:hypothetical protein